MQQAGGLSADLFLFEQGDLGGLHAKVGIVLQQLLCALMGISRRHDGERQLRIAARLCLQRQYRLYVQLQGIIDTGSAHLAHASLTPPSICVAGSSPEPSTLHAVATDAFCLCQCSSAAQQGSDMERRRRQHLQETGIARQVCGQRNLNAGVAQALPQAPRHQHKCCFPARFHPCSNTRRTILQDRSPN